MRTAIAVVILVAACANDHGILVVVSSKNSSVTTVRLFVGAGPPTKTSLAIPVASNVATDRSAISNVTYYIRDPHDRDDIVAIEGPRDVTFAYETTDDIPLVIAVGYDSNNEPITAGVLHDLVAPTGRNQFRSYQLDLDTQQTVFGPAGGPAGALRLGLWSSVGSALNLSTAQCAGIQAADEEAAYFVVNLDDQDCDGFKNTDGVECRPNIYNGSIAADPRYPSCLVDSPLGTAYPYCAGGGKPCQDGLGPMNGACTATHVCMPSTVCATSCGDQFACAAKMDDTQIMSGPYYECPIDADQTGARLCGGMLVTLERPPTGGFDCTAFQIGNSGFGDTLDQAGIHVKPASGSPTTGCFVALELNNGETGGATSFTGLTNFTLANNAGIAIPVRFEIQPGDCVDVQTPTTCYLVNDAIDTAIPADVGMTQCASEWSPTNAAVTGLLPATIQGGATVSKPGTEMFFIAGGTLFRARRINQMWVVDTTSASSFGLSQLHAPKLSADGLRLLFMADLLGNGTRLYEVSRLSTGLAFDPTTLVPIIDIAGRTIESATFGPNGNSLVIAAMNDGATGTYLYRVPLANGTLGPGNALEVTNTDGSNDRQPSLSYDALHLYFESDRNGLGDAIYVASRTSPDSEFSHPVRLPEVSAGLHTSVYPFVTDDGYTLYYDTPSAGLRSATRGAF
ncbi:hypothetical protein BH11MYX1_BH11MYX1_22290 [soil metagenome]